MPASPSATDCPACGSHDSAFWAIKDAFRLRRCRGCGALATAAPPDADVYGHYYDRAAFELHPIVRASLERLVGSAEAYRRSGRWLDVGYGEGGLLSVASRRGWSCYGTEVSGRALDRGRGQGWQVSDAPEADPRFAAAGFDVVTLIEVLEHASDPRALLRGAARWLRPGGLFYATTPNGHSLNRWLLREAWSVFSPPEHLTIWTPRGLARALREHGFAILELRTEGLNPSELLARLRPRPAAGQAPPSRNEAGLALNAALSSTPPRRLLKSLANRLLTALRLGDSLKIRARREAPPA